MDNKEKKEALRIIEIASLNIKLSTIALRLKELGISHKTLSFLTEAILQIVDKLDKINTNFQFNHIVKDLEGNKKLGGD